MISDHELPQDAEEPDFREEAHRHTLEDGAGFTPHTTEVALTGYDPDRYPYRRPHPAEPRHRVPHRGGRSLNEGTENEHDPNWNPVTEPLTDAEKARNAAWVQAIKLQLEKEREARHRG